MHSETEGAAPEASGDTPGSVMVTHRLHAERRAGTGGRRETAPESSLFLELHAGYTNVRDVSLSVVLYVLKK